MIPELAVVVLVKVTLLFPIAGRHVHIPDDRPQNVQVDENVDLEEPALGKTVEMNAVQHAGTHRGVSVGRIEHGPVACSEF